MGHRDTAAIRKAITHDMVLGMMVIKNDHDKEKEACECCIKGKLAKLPFRVSQSRVSKPLDFVHSDVCSPMPTVTPSGNRYILTLVDDHSRYCVVELINHKSEVPQTIEDYLAFVENKFSRKPKVLRTDNGKEYVNQHLRRILKTKGIEHQFTVVHTPE